MTRLALVIALVLALTGCEASCTVGGVWCWKDGKCVACEAKK